MPRKQQVACTCLRDFNRNRQDQPPGVIRYHLDTASPRIVVAAEAVSATSQACSTNIDNYHAMDENTVRTERN